FCFYCVVALLDLHSFPTRRSSDLGTVVDEYGHPLAAVTVAEKGTQATTISDESGRFELAVTMPAVLIFSGPNVAATTRKLTTAGDRKSTRLNSSHVKISYAVFCLK